MSYLIRPIQSEQLMLFKPSANLLLALELNQLNTKQIEFYLISKGSEHKAVFMDTSAINNTIFNNFFPYHGLELLDKNEQKKVHADNMVLEIQTHICDYYLTNNKSLSLKFLPEFNDIRSIQSHSQFSQKINFLMHYTSKLNIAELIEYKEPLNSLFFDNLDQLRQRNIKEAYSNGVKTTVGGQPILKKLLDFLKLPETNLELSILEKFLEILLQKHLGELFVSKNSEGSLLNISLFTLGSNYARYTLAANNPEISTRYSGSINLFEAFIYLAKVRKFREIDLNGINSGKSSLFKQSFAGTITPFFELLIKK